MRLLFLKIFLCFSGLLFGFAVLTETAFLQDAAPTPRPQPTAERSATPRPKKKSPTNKTSNAVTIEPALLDDELMTTSNLSSNGIPRQTPAPANSTVRGRVFYTDTGRAVKRAPIMLMSERGIGGPGNTPSALTDNDGNFQMKNVQAGVYYAMVNAPGVVSPMAFLDFSKMRGGASEAEEFEKAAEGFEKIIIDGITDLDVQIPARRGGAIGGRVTYDNGDPAIGVKVEILRKVKGGKFLPVIPNFGAIFALMTGSGGYQTDDRGVYRFAGLPAGEYIVKVTESATHSEPGDGRRSHREAEVMFGVVGGNSLLNVFYQDAFDSKSANVINVELGQEIVEINLTIPTRSLYKIEGKIVSRKDKSPVKARVTIKREGEQDVHSIFSDLGGRSDQSAVSDENGNWKFKELPKGNYKLLIEPAQSENEYREFQGDYSHYGNMANTNAQNSLPPRPKLAKKIREITLEDRDLSEMVIELGSGATISGTVVVENNEKMPRRVVITAFSADNELSSSDSVSNHDFSGDVMAMNGMGNSNVLRSSANVMRTPPGAGAADGGFKLENVSEGKIDIFIHVEDENYFVKSARADGVDLLSGKVEIKDGDNIKNVQIVLSKAVGTLKGKFVDENGEAMKNALFTLVPTDAARRGSSTFFRVVKTDAGGEFETKLAPMEYAVVFVELETIPRKTDELDEWYNKAVKDAQKVTIEAGRTENLTVRKIKK
ncbi:MAG TPA: carboxypeptidase-like regulatory domain-containing protein [Pyrinomonadaceae bacterium]|nr:carboxypeptidase-like regulatory domain-containing protein [Pyrinomonadaceae bacterium]